MEKNFRNYIRNNFLVIEMTVERFDFLEISQSSDAIRDIFRRAGYPNILFDLSRTKLIDSSGIGFLIEMRNVAKKYNREIAVINNDREVLRILEMMHVQQMLWIAADMAAVEARFSEIQSGGIE